jgi:hypothetical protein
VVCPLLRVARQREGSRQHRGYNFPRLPLMAFVPGGQGGKGERYIQRARFLAIAEFGPGSIVYHEGRVYGSIEPYLRKRGADKTGNPALPFHHPLCARER